MRWVGFPSLRPAKFVQISTSTRKMSASSSLREKRLISTTRTRTRWSARLHAWKSCTTKRNSIVQNIRYASVFVYLIKLFNYYMSKIRLNIPLSPTPPFEFFQVSWYLEKPPGSQIVTTFAPLLFTALLAVLNVVNAEGEGPALDNSIALCLTIVFVLPNLRVDGRGHKMHVAKGWKGKFWNFYYEVLLSNNAIVFFFFLGLAFTSVAHPWFFHMGRDFAEENAEGSGDWHAENGEARDYVPLTFWYKEHGITGLAFGPAERFGMIGMIFFVVSMIIPCLNYRRYSKFKKQIIKSSIVKLGKHGADVFNNAKGKGGKEKNKPETISDDMDHSWKKSADDERLAFAKDKTFDVWELQDSAVGKEAKKQTKSKDELTQVVASMNSVKTVWDAVTNAESATALNPAFDGKEVSAEAFSSHWKAKPEDPTLFCGPSHIEDEA